LDLRYRESPLLTVPRAYHGAGRAGPRQRGPTSRRGPLSADAPGGSGVPEGRNAGGPGYSADVTGTSLQGVRNAVEELAPGCFAVVMATGIDSVGLKLRGFDLLSDGLLAIAICAFVALASLTVCRLVIHPSAMSRDLRDPRRGFEFFTFVAGANVVGVRVGMDGHYSVTVVLLTLSGLVWLVLGYVVPFLAVLGHPQRPTVAAANGTWFLWVVATQSVAVASATVEPRVVPGRPEMALLAVLAWFVGLFLYGLVAVVVCLRLGLFEFGPADLTPPYWISMGALAITVLAGARIVAMADTPIVDVTRPLAAACAVGLWALATWLIPGLAAAEMWRHKRLGAPRDYSAALWSIAFPLGMYAVAALYLGDADRLPVIKAIGAGELWLAVVAWMVVFVAMTGQLLRPVWRDR
jgi:tellurite resistance protein TehA-like permease